MNHKFINQCLKTNKIIAVLFFALLSFNIQAKEVSENNAAAQSKASENNPVQTNSIAREWNELLLLSIRNDFARPTVHARNLFHTSLAMWDAWAAYDETACTYLLGKTVDGFSCAFAGISTPADIQEAREKTISFAAYRILSHRFTYSPEAPMLQTAYDGLMLSLNHNRGFTSTDYTVGGPSAAAALGNYIAECVINFGLQDNAREQFFYTNANYSPVNDPLIVDNYGNPDITDYNRWQPLALETFIDQSGNEIPNNVPNFLSPEWGIVSPFCLQPNDLTVNQRNNFDYWVYHDPGPPPLLMMDGSGQSADYQWGFATVVTWSSHLDPTDGVMIDISPATLGNNPTLPATISDYPNYYNQLNGGTTNTGYTVNPSTGQPYASNMVPRADYARVLAEFWADGPDSETPPGHWFTLVNYVSDHPDFEKRFEGEGPILDDLEWDVKAYFAMGGAMHDAAIAAWGIKGWYDYIRPITAIRAMADLGQSSDSNLPSYHPAGIPLISGYIELVYAGDPLAGASNEYVGDIKVKSWKGPTYITDPSTDVAGVDWILAGNWTSYQRPTFVTPPFAGYISGHSTYSRAAAEMLTLFTGDAYFPGGMGTFLAPQNDFLVFENGPSQNIELQWATYRDAAEQSALSRIWGGIHPPADDIPGRIIGEQIGIDAFHFATNYFNYDCEPGVAVSAKVLLEGAYDTSTNLMKDELRSFGYLPLTEPYTGYGYTHIGGGNESTDQTVLDRTGDDAIVDWVFAELRDAMDETVIVATRSGLLQADGDIVDVDGVSPLYFRAVTDGDYFIVIKHKSHLGVMTQSPVALTRSAGSLIDFTGGVITYGTDPQKELDGAGTYGLFAGDLNASGFVDADDRSNAWNFRNTSGYIQNDGNMDGVVDSEERSITWNNRNKMQQVP